MILLLLILSFLCASIHLKNMYLFLASEMSSSSFVGSNNRQLDASGSGMFKISANSSIIAAVPVVEDSSCNETGNIKVYQI